VTSVTAIHAKTRSRAKKCREAVAYLYQRLPTDARGPLSHGVAVGIVNCRSDQYELPLFLCVRCAMDGKSKSPTVHCRRLPRWYCSIEKYRYAKTGWIPGPDRKNLPTSASASPGNPAIIRRSL